MEEKNIKEIEILGLIKEWEPFSDYPKVPCFVLYQGELAIYAPSLDDIPLLVKEG